MSTPLEQIAARLLKQIDDVCRDAERQTKPLEIDPYRSQLFEWFAQAYAAGLTRPGSSPDLTADGLCRSLAQNWGLSTAAQQWMTQATQLPKDQMIRMRTLWSVMRLWMEWSYAWDRYEEFNRLA